MTSDRLEDIVVPFPFTDRPITRPLPAVIVSSPGSNRTHDQSILAMITSARSEWPGDVALRDWQEAGLNVRCKGRLKLFALDDDLVVRRLGTLSQSGRHTVDEALMRQTEGGRLLTLRAVDRVMVFISDYGRESGGATDTASWPRYYRLGSNRRPDRRLRSRVRCPVRKR